MAYILKSNVIVEDNDGKFPYLTPFGETNKYVAAYFREMADKGYDLTSSDFDSLNSFTQELIDSGAMSSIVELYPFMGDTLEHSLVKLKYKSVNSAFVRNSNGAVSFDGKGLDFPNYFVTGAMGIGTGFKVSDAYAADGFGVSAYVKYNPSDVRTAPRHIFSVSATASGAEGGVADAILVARRPNGGVTNRILNSAPSFSDIPTAQNASPGIITITNRWNGVKQLYERTNRWNSSILGTSASIVQLNAPTFETDFNIGSNHVLADNSSNYSFHGQIRFLAVLDGSVDDVRAEQIESAINAFMTSTGKNVF